MTARRSREKAEGAGSARPLRLPRPLLTGSLLVFMALLLFNCSGCSPVYLARAGWTEMKILTGRRPLAEVIEDEATDAETREKLLLTRQARAFAIHQLGLNAGDSYTSFTRLDSDTLAWVLSAAYRDRLEAKTWWFPVVGRVPYRGYASRSAAEKARAGLEKEGYDTYLRPTTVFSTLGWFADPLLSSLLRYDDVDLVETILHELSHNHLFLSGKVRFNESFATFVGRAGAIRFFCGPREKPQNTERCGTARDRWSEYQRFSSFLDVFVEELQAVYERPDLGPEEKVAAREELFRAYQERYLEADPEDVSPLVRGFLTQPLNNAVLMARMRYFHRLPDFQTYLEDRGGDLREAVADLKREVREVDDPFRILPARD